MYIMLLYYLVLTNYPLEDSLTKEGHDAVSSNNHSHACGIFLDVYRKNSIMLLLCFMIC